MASMMTINSLIDVDMSVDMDMLNIDPAASNMHQTGDFYFISCFIKFPKYPFCRHVPVFTDELEHREDDDGVINVRVLQGILAQ